MKSACRHHSAIIIITVSPVDAGSSLRAHILVTTVRILQYAPQCQWPWLQTTVTDGALVLAATVAMPSPAATRTLPTATIQDDFTTVISEVHAGIIPSEDIWLSCYKDGEPSIHGKISVSLHEQDRDRVELVGRGGVELTRTSQVSHFFLSFFL